MKTLGSQAIAIISSFAVLGFPAILSAQTVSGGTDVSVEGIVRDARTSKPIFHALVTSQDRSMAAFSGRDGRFQLAVHLQQTNTAASGGSGTMYTNIFFVARKPGYLQTSTPANWSYNGSSSPSFVEMKLTPESILKGHISTPGLDTPANVRVQLMRRQIQDGRATWVRAQQASTNSQGEFRIPDLPAGDYKLMSLEWVDNAAVPVTSAPAPGLQPRQQRGFRPGPQPALPPTTQSGFPPVFYPNAPSEAAATAIHLEAGQTLDANLNLHPETYFPVRIPILNSEAGQGINVRVITPDGNTGFSLGIGSGRHTVEGALPNGSYDVELNSYGQNPLAAVTRLTVAGAPAEAPPLTLTHGGAIPVNIHEDFTNAANKSIVTGNNQRSLNLFLRSESGDQSASLRNQPGAANDPPTLENVRPGRYDAQIGSFHGYVASATSGGVDLLHNSLVVAPGGTAPPIEITLRDDSATLTGTVNLPPNDATTIQTGTPIFCFPVGNGAERYTQGYTGPDGKFTIPNLAPGTYLVVALRTNNPSWFGNINIEYRNPEVLRPFRTRTNQITLAPGAEATIQLEATSYDLD